MTTFKQHIESIIITFISTFFLIVSFEISSPDFVFSKDAIIALLVSGAVAGTRSIAKIIYEVSKSVLESGKNIE